MKEKVPVPDDVTIAVTSCGRRDLLSETLDSFRRFHEGGRLVISEDSADPDMLAWLRAAYPEATIVDSPGRTGLMASIDRLYGAIETPYVFHLEDDWAFDGPVDFALAKTILNAEDKVSVVCVRVFEELKARHRATSAVRRIGGVELRTMDPAIHPEWYGYSSNPGLLRHAFWKQYAPVARYRHDELSGLAKGQGWAMTYLLPGVARHIGDGRHVADPAQPGKRDKGGLFRKLRKSLRKALGL